MRGRHPVGFTVISAVAVLAAMAVGTSAALATTVKPANTKVTASLQPETDVKFVLGNGYIEIWYACSSGGLSFTTPKDGEHLLNTNKTGTGTFSLGPGSVGMSIEGKPLFQECSLREGNPEEPGGPGEEIVPATVTAGEKWVVAATEQSKETGIVALGMPLSGITLKFNLLGECVTTVAPANLGVVTGTLANGTHDLRLDGQLPYTVNSEDACAGIGQATPLQLEADYESEAGGEGKELEILP